MATITNPIPCSEDTRQYRVIHPLDDTPEEKVDTESLGPMPMTRTVKWSLLSLRGYLMVMLMLVIFHVLQLAGLFAAVH